MKFTNTKFILILLLLLIIIVLFGYFFYYNFNYNYNYNHKVQEKFEYTPTIDESSVLKKLSEYSNSMTNNAPTIVNDIQEKINTIISETTPKQNTLETTVKTNINDLKTIELSIQNDINKIHRDMDGSTILPINKKILENFNGTPQFPIPTSLKVFEKFADTTDWRTEWNNKLASIYSVSSNLSPKDMDPLVNKDKTQFYIVKNPKLEENLNNISSQIIKNNLDNISNKLKSQWLKNKF